MFRENLFRAKLVERGCTLEHVASVLGINYATLYRKITGVSDFSRSEVQQLRDALVLSNEETFNIFFAD